MIDVNLVVPHDLVAEEARRLGAFLESACQNLDGVEWSQRVAAQMIVLGSMFFRGLIEHYDKEESRQKMEKLVRELAED